MPGAIANIMSLIKISLGGIGQLHLTFLMLQAFVQFFQFNLDQLRQGIFLDRRIMQGPVNPVEKFRIKTALHHLFNHLSGRQTFKTEVLHFFREQIQFVQILLRGLGTDITGHENHAIAKVDGFGARSQGQFAGVQHIHQPT